MVCFSLWPLLSILSLAPLRGNLIIAHYYLQGRCQDGARLFSVFSRLKRPISHSLCSLREVIWSLNHGLLIHTHQVPCDLALLRVTAWAVLVTKPPQSPLRETSLSDPPRSPSFSATPQPELGLSTFAAVASVTQWLLSLTPNTPQLPVRPVSLLTQPQFLTAESQRSQSLKIV